MSEVLCSKCGEPWDAYGVRNGDMSTEEAQKFERGQGCPCCGFGTVCPSCNGNGKTVPSYALGGDRCCSDGRRLAWIPSQDFRGEGGTRYEAGETYVGYSPNVEHVPDPKRWRATIAGKQIEPPAETHETRDGYVSEVWIVCPTCNGEGEHLAPCESCNGSGNLADTIEDPDDLALRAARSAVDASDEEPIGILEKRGVLD